MIRRILLSTLLFLLLLAPQVGLAYDSGICNTGSTCEKFEVGPLMQDISKECGNSGTCSLADIMTVFANVGNYILGIVGAIVLLMYVIGGIYMLTSAGKQENVQKGKKYLTVSTMGLLIVMFAFLGIHSLESALVSGTFFSPYPEADGYYTCVQETISRPCGLNKTCTSDLTCVDKCTQQYGGKTLEKYYSPIGGDFSEFKCLDKTNTTEEADKEIFGNYYKSSTCKKDLCDGGVNNQCCQYWTWDGTYSE